MPKCAIWNCQTRVGPKDKSAVYNYAFPRPGKSPDRFASWSKHTKQGRVINKEARVCAKHFVLEDFEESDMLKIRLAPNLYKRLVPKLKKGVVPTVNVGEEDTKDGILSCWNVQETPDEAPIRGQSRGSSPSTSRMFQPCEIKIEDGEPFEAPPRNSVGIQCEFGGEVYRRRFDAVSETVDK